MNPAAQARLRFLFRVVLLLLAVWLAFAPAASGDWLWDDSDDIVNNLDLRDATGLAHIWVAPTGINYWPLRATFQWLMWQAWQDRPTGYHLVNIALHAASALLLWRLFARLGLRFAWAGALAFAVHPLTVESVVWVTELKNTSSLFFVLLAALAWVGFDVRGGRRLYLAAVACFLAAMLCKSSVAMFPCVLLLFAWWRRGRVVWRDVLLAAPFFAVSLGLGLVTIWFEHHRGLLTIANDIPHPGLPARAVIAGQAVWFYFWKCLWPAGLMPVYPRWPVPAAASWSLLAWPALAAGLAGLWLGRRRWGRGPLFAAGFFVLNLLPALGFVPMAYARFSWVADHFAYVALIGIVALATAVAGALVRHLPPRSHVVFATGAAAILALFVVLSRRQAAHFQGPVALWSYTLSRDPDSWIAHNNLGAELFQQQRLPESVAHFQTAIRLNPAYSDAHNNLGVALDQLGRKAEALQEYQIALRLAPKNPGAQANLADILFAAGYYSDAVEHYEAALRTAPHYAVAHYRCGLALERLGHPGPALPHFEAAVEFDPQSALFRFDLGNALVNAGRPADASIAFAAALALNPNYAEAHNNYGIALARLGHFAEAIMHFQRAVALRPDYAEARRNLALAVTELKKQGAARR